MQPRKKLTRRGRGDQSDSWGCMAGGNGCFSEQINWTWSIIHHWGMEQGGARLGKIDTRVRGDGMLRDEEERVTQESQKEPSITRSVMKSGRRHPEIGRTSRTNEKTWCCSSQEQSQSTWAPARHCIIQESRQSIFITFPGILWAIGVCSYQKVGLSRRLLESGIDLKSAQHAPTIRMFGQQYLTPEWAVRYAGHIWWPQMPGPGRGTNAGKRPAWCSLRCKTELPYEESSIEAWSVWTRFLKKGFSMSCVRASSGSRLGSHLVINSYWVIAFNPIHDTKWWKSVVKMVSRGSGTK